MKSKEDIVEIVQNELDVSEEGIDLLEYIFLCDDLTDEEKEWAAGNLGVSITVTQF